MNNKIKIPKGWRKLKVGEVIKRGDKVSLGKPFVMCNGSIGETLDQLTIATFIRKIKSPKRKSSIIIPSGYKKLANGTIIKKGDLFYHPDDREWYNSMADGLKVIPHFIYARKK